MSTTAVVVGSGSAGRRHAATLRTALPDVELLVVRRTDSAQPVGAFEALGASLVPALEDAIGRGPDVAIVASPAPLHAGDALTLLRSGIPTLVEKPLAADPGDARRLVEAASRPDAAMVVGYHLRCADTPLAFRSALDELGGVSSFSLRVGQHLSTWRPGTDPRRGVTARHELGGGVLLELSHELDAVQWLFGPISEVRARLDHHGAPTDGVVETVAELELTLDDGRTGSVHLDMVSDPPVRTWEVRGPTGVVQADLLEGTVTRIGPDGDRDGERSGAGTVLHRSRPGERDRAALALVRHLLDVADGLALPLCSAAQAAHVVEVVDAARRSANDGGSGQAVDRRASTPREHAG